MAQEQQFVAVTSTGHLTLTENDYLPDWFKFNGVKGCSLPAGYLVSTSFNLDLPPNLSYVLGYFRAKNYSWVKFDSDAPKEEELPQYFW
jgi:hypothetical protein